MDTTQSTNKDRFTVLTSLKTIKMRTLINNPGFLVNLPTVLNEVLSTEFQNNNYKQMKCL